MLDGLEEFAKEERNGYIRIDGKSAAAHCYRCRSVSLSGAESFSPLSPSFCPVGKTSMGKRAKLVDHFQQSQHCQLAILSIGAAGTGTSSIAQELDVALRTSRSHVWLECCAKWALCVLGGRSRHHVDLVRVFTSPYVTMHCIAVCDCTVERRPSSSPNLILCR